MNRILNRIERAKHVVVIAHLNPNADSIASASAMYTYLLILHKKVSFYCATEDINNKFSFLPWFEKIRSSFPKSADLAISFDYASTNTLKKEFECDLINIYYHNSKHISSTHFLYDLFIENRVSINKKMATALYAGLLGSSNGFLDESVDGRIFAIISELIALGADYKRSNNFIMKYLSLSAFRLKAIMYKDMKLYHEAKLAFFCVTQEDMKATGALEEECDSVLNESLYLPSVEVALLVRQNSDLSFTCSLRSCAEIEVLNVALHYAGRGNSNCAEFNISNELSVEEVIDKALKLIYKDIV